jgi:hypothetical protein
MGNANLGKTKSDRTRHDLEMAILRIERGRPRIIKKEKKLSILSVAEEAGISSASIHNNYPEIAEQIRVKINKDTRNQRDAKSSELKTEKEKNKTLRTRIAVLTQQLRDIASENARLLTELQNINAIVSSDNIFMLKSRK